MADRLKAWLVHIFTASGILTVFMALVETGMKDFRSAMLWLLAAQFIDGLDGTLARRYRVEEVLPQMSGKSIDFVIDFSGYAVVPAYMMYQADLMPDILGLLMSLLIVLTSAIYYGKAGMVTNDLYFKGFPVMWNMVAFYLIFIFSFPPGLNVAVVVILTIMQFVPIKFAYPSLTRRWMPATLAITTIFLISVTGLLWYYPQYPVIFYWGAIISLLYFAGFGFAATFVFKD